MSEVSDIRFYVASAAAGTVSAYAVGAGPVLRTVQVIEVGPDIAALSIHANRLYAALRSGPAVVSLHIDADEGSLRMLATTPTAAPLVHLATSSDGRRLFGASYSEGVIESIGLDDDGIATPAGSAVFAAGPNAHSVLPAADGASVWAAVLGHDVVRRIPLDDAGQFGDGTVIDVALPRGFGPRHQVLEPTGHLLVIGERTAEVARISARTNEVVEVWRTVPDELDLAPGIVRGPGENPSTDESGRLLTWAADIAISPDGFHVYTTERRTSLVSHTSAASGALVGTTATEQQPRGIGIDPTGQFLLATGELSDTVTLYSIDAADGQLQPLDRAAVGAGALWAEPYVLPRQRPDRLDPQAPYGRGVNNSMGR